jgi:hypothetical protein
VQALFEGKLAAARVRSHGAMGAELHGLELAPPAEAWRSTLRLHVLTQIVEPCLEALLSTNGSSTVDRTRCAKPCQNAPQLRENWPFHAESTLASRLPSDRPVLRGLELSEWVNA